MRGKGYESELRDCDVDEAEARDLTFWRERVLSRDPGLGVWRVDEDEVNTTTAGSVQVRAVFPTGTVSCVMSVGDSDVG
jgi:hypothetical protein